MSEIKEFIKKEKTKSPSAPEHPASSPTAKALTLLCHKNAPLISLILFGVLFILDVFLTSHFTATSIVFCCILLVLQTGIAVCLDQLNYAGLVGIAALELLIGIITHNLLLVVLCLLLYFAALFVIHILHINGGLKLSK